MSQRPQGVGTMSSRPADWQDAAWLFYDTVGELRFGVGWIANAMSRVNLIAARAPEQQGDDPSAIALPDPDDIEAIPLTAAEQLAVTLVAQIAGGPAGQGQLLGAASLQLSIPGIGYLLASDPAHADAEPGVGVRYAPADDGETHPVPTDTWVWSVLSQDEIRAQGDGYEVQTGPSQWSPLPPDSLLIRFWRPHPRRGWEADSPCRAVLPVLQQITSLDAHVAATATSRLAGAGLLVMPAEAEFAPLPGTSSGSPIGLDSEPADDDFVQTLVDTMTLPITDRGSAAAVVPLTVRIPGEFCDKVQHLTFWSDFSENTLPLRDSAVKRLALGLDMPPEVLTGMAGMNHWGAWQVEETAITLHCEPQAEAVVNAFTVGYLRPALRAAGYADDADHMLVWYDTTDLTTRPDKSDDAIAAYDRMELSGQALRREAGLSETDAPDEDEFRMRVLLDLAKAAPTLAPQMLAEAGLLDPDVAAAAADAAAGQPQPPAVAPQPPQTPTAPDQGPPADDGITGSGALLAACDGLVSRALERAGGRLRSAAGRGSNGGAATIAPGLDATLIHTQLDASRYSLDSLLADAWSRCPQIGQRYDVDVAALTATLDAYTRALLATGHAHELDRLADALGLAAAR